MKVRVGSRASKLARVQLYEMERELKVAGFDVEFVPVWIETTGDKDLTTSLRKLEKTNFFTKELDEALLAGHIDFAVHSAKDLPDPLPKALEIVFMTKGVDPRDALVMRPGAVLQQMKRIATSSVRREQAVEKICSGVTFVDLRGTIEERLKRLEIDVDGVVVAEAALIRLGLNDLNRVFLPGDTVEGQGKLALLSRCKKFWPSTDLLRN